jgi:cysteinyl-tRNA synthetase
MDEIYLTNTLTKKKELFTPITPKTVGMYHCGPTVYDSIHIGNLRAFLLADITRRVFEYNDYQVGQVMNITDIGHLVSDGDDGDDKMTKGLKREGLEVNLENMLQLARKYEEVFLADIAEMNILRPKIIARASEHVAEDIAMIEQLEAKGFTYTTSDGIYFDTEKMPDYGKLGGLDHTHESRIGEISEKKNPRDFALWKFDTDKGWQSPWGQGFPGWHIECSGMSTKYLGDQFDIHTGGHDLASVHHNNEIAQSECATGHAPFVRYWLHNEFVNIGQEKMAKSGSNFITLQTLREHGTHPVVLRYLYLQSHYRTPVSFSWDALSAAETALKKLYSAIARISEIGMINESYKAIFTQTINDDFNTAGALAVLWELVKDPEISDADKKATMLHFDQVLGLGFKEITPEEQEIFEIPEHIEKLLKERDIARGKKDWHSADLIRNEIQALGYALKDTDEGQKIRKI